MLCTTGSSVLSGDHSPDIRGIGTEKGHFVVILLFWIIASFFSTDHCVKEMNVYSQPMQCISCSLLSAPPTFLILTTFCHWNAWGGRRVMGKGEGEGVEGEGEWERGGDRKREKKREGAPTHPTLPLLHCIMTAISVITLDMKRAGRVWWGGFWVGEDWRYTLCYQVLLRYSETMTSVITISQIYLSFFQGMGIMFSYIFKLETTIYSQFTLFTPSIVYYIYAL